MDIAEEPVTTRLYSPTSASLPWGSIYFPNSTEVRYDHLTYFGQSNLNRRDMWHYLAEKFKTNLCFPTSRIIDGLVEVESPLAWAPNWPLLTLVGKQCEQEISYCFKPLRFSFLLPQHNLACCNWFRSVETKRNFPKTTQLESIWLQSLYSWPLYVS